MKTTRKQIEKLQRELSTARKQRDFWQRLYLAIPYPTPVITALKVRAAETEPAVIQ